MLNTDPITCAPACNLAEDALALFCRVYGLSWDDSYLAAEYQQQHGQSCTTRVLRLISRDGCTFDAARAIVEATDADLLAA